MFSYSFLYLSSLYSIICVSDYVLLYMWLNVLCDYMFMYVWCVSVPVYCPTYCGLVRGRGCLLNGQHLITWARVYRVDVL